MHTATTLKDNGYSPIQEVIFLVKYNFKRITQDPDPGIFQIY